MQFEVSGRIFRKDKTEKGGSVLGILVKRSDRAGFDDVTVFSPRKPEDLPDVDEMFSAPCRAFVPKVNEVV